MATKRNKNHISDWVKNQVITEPPEIRLLKNEIKLLQSKLSDKAASETLIIDAVKENLEPLVLFEPYKLQPKKDKRKGVPSEIAMLHISDTQIGKITPTYNTQVAEERLLLLAEKTIEIIKLRRNMAKIDELVLFLGGDIVEGEEIFAGQSFLIDSDVFEQAVRSAPAILVKVILRLLDEIQTVRVRCVPGNHGRNARGQGSKSTNWDNVCYAVTKLAVEASRPDLKERLDFKEPTDWYVVHNIFDWGILCVHGDQIKGGFGGFPWYGAAKKIWGWIDSIPANFDYILMGHFHTYASVVLNHRILLANGTSEDSNTYAQEQLAASGYPCQRLAFFDPRHGLIADNQIFLCNNRKPQKLRSYK